MHRLTWFLLREPHAAEKVGLASGPPNANWLLVDRPRALEKPPASRGAYQGEGLARVLEILFAESIEPTVRRSAGEQASIFLQSECVAFEATFHALHGLCLKFVLLISSLLVLNVAENKCWGMNC